MTTHDLQAATEPIKYVGELIVALGGAVTLVWYIISKVFKFIKDLIYRKLPETHKKYKLGSILAITLSISFVYPYLMGTMYVFYDSPEMASFWFFTQAVVICVLALTRKITGADMTLILIATILGIYTLHLDTLSRYLDIRQGIGLKLYQTRAEMAKKDYELTKTDVELSKQLLQLFEGRIDDCDWHEQVLQLIIAQEKEIESLKEQMAKK